MKTSARTRPVPPGMVRVENMLLTPTAEPVDLKGAASAKRRKLVAKLNKVMPALAYQETKRVFPAYTWANYVADSQQILTWKKPRGRAGKPNQKIEYGKELYHQYQRDPDPALLIRIRKLVANLNKPWTILRKFKDTDPFTGKPVVKICSYELSNRYEYYHVGALTKIIDACKDSFEWTDRVNEYAKRNLSYGS